MTWNSSGQDANGEGVYAQRYNASGEKDGAEFRVNTYQTGNEMHSEVTAGSAAPDASPLRVRTPDEEDTALNIES